MNYPPHSEFCVYVLVSSPDPPVREKREREGLEHNPGRKCPEGRNSVTGVDWPQYLVLRLRVGADPGSIRGGFLLMECTRSAREKLSHAHFAR